MHLKFIRRKEALGRPKLRWEKNIKLYVKEIEYECVSWGYVAKDYVSLQGFVKAKKLIGLNERAGIS